MDEQSREEITSVSGAFLTTDSLERVWVLQEEDAEEGSISPKWSPVPQRDFRPELCNPNHHIFLAAAINLALHISLSVIYLIDIPSSFMIALLLSR